MIEIKKSSIKNGGYGVWATQDILEDTAITEYYGSKLSLEKYDDLQAIFLSNANSLTEDQIKIIQNDAVLNCGSYYIVGEKQYKDKSKCGQIINDVSFLKDFSEKSFYAYDDSSKDCNVYPVFGEPTLMFSSRKIKKGEELFYHYGNKYWQSRIKSNDEKGFLKFNIFEIISNSIKNAKVHK